METIKRAIHRLHQQTGKIAQINKRVPKVHSKRNPKQIIHSQHSIVGLQVSDNVRLKSSLIN